MSLSNSIIGKKYGRLTILQILDRIKSVKFVKTQCECGRICVNRLYSLTSGNTKSCGCLNLERLIKHGKTGDDIHFLWKNVLARCYNKNSASFKYYGGNGVVMCDEWKNDFMTFYNWAIKNGWRKGLHLDKDKLSSKRVGNIYAPDFCCFIEKKENSRHKSNNIYLLYNNKEQCLMDWSIETGISYNTLRARIIRLKWSAEKALSTVPKNNYIR